MDWKTNAEEDSVIEHAVLDTALEADPAMFTEDELIRAIANDPDDFGERDEVERAIQALLAVGLLHRVDCLVVPSVAARRFAELARQGGVI